jgi:hypothetical protein
MQSGMRVLLRSLALALVTSAVAAPAASAYPQLPYPFPAVAGNPADRLLDRPIEPPVYDRARRCTPRKARPGVAAMAAWLAANVRGQFWGSYRCERWGKGSASLHAENRAIDWHLDVRSRADRRAALGVIEYLLAPDALGNPQALARRMGVQELIWDCGYWGAGMATFRPYGACYKRNGQPRRRVDRTTAHMDHIHIGMTRDGAMARTSFWTG